MGLMHNPALFLTLMSGTSAAALSGAASLLANEDQGLALDFTDTTWFSTTGFNGSARVKDTTTPANEYDTSPTTTSASLLTYTAPSPKLTLQSDGTYKYQAHNLYLNSASPANQSITVVSGATYAVTITGSVSTTASGAASGTWTAGTQTFTAATGTLTFGSTSGSGTVHVRRTPSVDTYLATGASSRFGLPLEWNTSGVLQGMRVEEARTNFLLNSAVLTSATAANHTVTVADAFGSFNFYKLVRTATGASRYVGSQVALTSGTTYTISGHFKASSSFVNAGLTVIDPSDATPLCFVTWNLSTGVATTQNNGGMGTIVAHPIQNLGGGVYRCALTFTPTESTTYRCGASAGTAVNDEIQATLLQLETGSFPTSPIETFASTVTRAADNISLATSAFPSVLTAATFYAEYSLTVRDPAGNSQFAARLVDNAGNNDIRLLGNNGGTSASAIVNSGGVTQSSQAVNNTLNATNKIAIGVTTNDAAFYVDGTAATADTSVTMPTALDTLWIGGLSSTTGFSHRLGVPLRKIMVLPRRMSNAELQTLTGA